MPRLVFALFCQQPVVDQFSNNISIINQFDEITIMAPPAVPVRLQGKKARLFAPMQCSILSVWEREKPTISETTELKVTLQGPKREQLAEIRAQLDLRNHPRMRQLGNLPGLPLAGEGKYTFVLRYRDGVRWRKAGEVTFQLKHMAEPKTKTAAH
jgi:hypothetical protein